MSGSRLHYRPFGGAKQPAVRKEDYSHGGVREWKGPEPDFAAFVGIDWADQKHCWKLVVTGTQASESGELKQTPEELSNWVTALHHRFGGCPVAVALEQSSGALVYQLSQYPNLWLYPVHPATAAHYRKTFYPYGSKSDPAHAAATAARAPGNTAQVLPRAQQPFLSHSLRCELRPSIRLPRRCRIRSGILE